MTWRPLVTGERCAEIAQIVRDIVEAVDTAPHGGGYDLADRALVRAYAAEADVAPDPDERSGEALAAAVTELTTGQFRGALFGGVAGIGWRVSHVAAEEDSELVCRPIDAALLRLVAGGEAEYDLIGGVVGFGVYALARGAAGHELAAAVVGELERMARPQRVGVALHTPPSWLPAWQRAEAPDGYWNFGLAHGMPGVAALLARFVAAGIEVARSRALLDGVVGCLLAIEPAANSARYPSWIAGGPDTQIAALEIGDRRGRLAWCYNDLGASIALLSAADATGNAAWRAEALALALSCAGRDEARALVRDGGLCHGALGAAHVFGRLWQATGDAEFERAARHWLDRGLAMRMDRPLAGFPASSIEDGVENWIADPSLLAGASGVALALHAMITSVEPAWDAVMLTDLAPASE